MNIDVIGAIFSHISSANRQNYTVCTELATKNALPIYNVKVTTRKQLAASLCLSIMSAKTMEVEYGDQGWFMLIVWLVLIFVLTRVLFL